MKNKNWSKRFIWFLYLGATICSLTILISASHAQNRAAKLMMRLGEERVLEDGLRIGLSKGEGDLIVVTISREASTPPAGSITTDELLKLSQGSGSKIKLGSYRALATIHVTFGRFPAGVLTEEIKIRLQSIDNDGNVKGEFVHNTGTGPVKGQIDGTGTLHLEGVIVGQSEWQVSLTAQFDDDALKNGKFTLTQSGPTKGVAKGEFRIALLGRDR
jgi:hypothetical protein